MNPELTHLMARARLAELRRIADVDRAVRQRSADPYVQTQVAIRLAEAADEPTLLRLAELDSARPLTHPIIVAESCGKLVAALALEDRSAVADPFEPTAALLELLLVRADQIEADRAAGRPRLGWLRALLAGW
jgi:hypothetical protein